MSSVKFAQVQEALRAMGIEKHEEVMSVVWEPHTITVTRKALRDGKTYLDESGDFATTTDVFKVDYTNGNQTASGRMAA
ncbi:hypothetical protein Rhe02_55540 [Rhizocola hellebori]|uniref:Uncharacterized protein n=1 Tax=Rhizocola hellebori TaxID=1392758 RepID=A0A8J3QCH1_9ACTN|nr:hypothetical protein [Rhizocola hellebori]GIH07487.1 hypothetical protein Rhe02_55540 [Rhizocola hellebori]